MKKKKKKRESIRKRKKKKQPYYASRNSARLLNVSLKFKQVCQIRTGGRYRKEERREKTIRDTFLRFTSIFFFFSLSAFLQNTSQLTEEKKNH